MCCIGTLSSSASHYLESHAHAAATVKPAANSMPYAVALLCGFGPGGVGGAWAGAVASACTR